jgi:hypothetical protein
VVVVNADLLAALDASLVATLAHVGTFADYRVGGTGPLLSLVVSVSELADDYIQRRYGHERTRVADVLIRRAGLVDPPAHGDTVTIADGPHAGTWTVLGIERRDDVSIVVRVRRSARIDAASPGAREVRR